MSDSRIAMPSLKNEWGVDLVVAVCPHCQWRYLIGHDAAMPTCPNCYQSPLAVLADELSEMPQRYPPELIVPYNLTKQTLTESIQSFTAGIPFAPSGLSEPGIRAGLTPIYLPMWLVDGAVSGVWQAETGFNYEVVSHQESYNGDMKRWQSHEIKEPRVRWENRVGRLNRAYQNIAAPALDDSSRLEKQIGRFNLDSARTYDPDCLFQNGRQAYIRLPDQPPKEAWSEAAAAFQKTAMAECQQACTADHLRQFRWKAQFTHLNWTLMLLPLYSASYRDDEGKPQPILIHGQTGQIGGVRKASMRRARQTSLEILLAGIFLFLLGILLDSIPSQSPFISAISACILIIGIVGIIATVVPILIVWDFNRKQALDMAETKL